MGVDEDLAVAALRSAITGATVTAVYLALAWLSAEFIVLERLTVWYAPAGLALGLGVVAGWRALPAVALGEVLVGVLLFGVGQDFGWLVVPNGVLYATVYVGFGHLVTSGGAIGSGPLDRRPGRMVGLIAAATVTAAVVGVAMQLVAGVATVDEAPQAVALWWLGDLVGVAGIGATVVTLAIRRRRGGRWWALPEIGVAESIGLILLPPLLTLAVPLVTDGVAPFAAAVFLPSLLLAVRAGVPGVALSAPLTSLAMTAVADSRFGSDALALSDLQLVLLLLLATSFGAAFVIEAQRELRVRLATRGRHLAQAQRQARSGSFRWDVPDDTVEWSDGLFALFGTTRHAVHAADYLERVHPDDRARVGTAIETALRTGDPHEHSYRVVRDDGEVLVVRARLQPRSFDGRVVELLGTCTDVTVEEEATRRLEQVVAAEQQARAAEEQARDAIARTERIKDALLIAVSHEVRTPLTIVSGLVETLRRDDFRDDRVAEHADLLERLQRNVARLRKVLQDLLDVDRIGRGVVHPVRRPCDLHDLAEQVLATTDHGDSDIRVDIPRVTVEVDARLTARILEHLVANAVRHGGQDIRIVGRAEDSTVELRVEDDGPGVEAPDRERVFDAFEHGDVPDHSPGTGVGLFVVARFVELQGGRIWVEDVTDGRGAAFCVELPTTMASDSAGPPPDPA